ncbi:MAG: ABC transporter substrate-binding protein [Burkholderiales bacterium]
MWLGILIFVSLLNVIFVPPAFAQTQRDLDKLVAAAEKEGEVTIYGQARAGVAKAIHAFTDAYPKIKINFVGGQGSDLSKKVFAERRAGKNLVDVAVGGGSPMILYHKAGTLRSLPEIFCRARSPRSIQVVGKRHYYADSDNRHVFMSQGDAGSGIGAINTASVKASEIKSWWDLLNPKWKGKLVMNDPRGLGNVGSWRFLYYDDDLGAKYLRRLVAEMDIVFAQDERQTMDWLAAGKYHINLLAKIENTAVARKQGLPVAQIFSEKEADALTSGSGHISVFKDGPHPHAAQLYINWFLSRDGQLNWQKHTGRNSFRADLPKDMLEFQEIQIPKEGGKYLMTSAAKYEDIEPVRKLVGELFSDGKKR